MPKLNFILSQSGNDNPQSATSGNLIKGFTYEILSYNLGDDFTLCGAPNNNVGTKFISNGKTPTWINDSEIGWNNTPAVVVKKNTIGYVWFERFDNGDYLLKSNGLFKEDMIFIPQNRGYTFPEAENITCLYAIYWVDENTIRINVTDYTSTVFLDDSIRDCPFTVKLYNKDYK